MDCGCRSWVRASLWTPGLWITCSRCDDGTWDCRSLHAPRRAAVGTWVPERDQQLRRLLGFVGAHPFCGGALLAACDAGPPGSSLQMARAVCARPSFACCRMLRWCWACTDSPYLHLPSLLPAQRVAGSTTGMQRCWRGVAATGLHGRWQGRRHDVGGYSSAPHGVMT
jgi:hypothetical protein